MVPTYLHLIASALLPIYAGAHASLTRPSSAAKPSRSKEAATSEVEADEKDEDEETVSKIEGLSASDAIWFPILAGCTLGGLYLIIKWLEDPSILSKILNWYFAVFGVLGVARLFHDSLGVITSFILPSRYLHHGHIWEIDIHKRIAASRTNLTQPRSSPLPGFLSTVPLPASVNRLFWSLRSSYPTLCIRLNLRPTPNIHTHVTPSAILSFVAALGLVLFYNLVSRPWYLTNILGFAFAYNALQLISPTTSSTGTLILSSLFIYDIYFVFYTPLMVTVATSLDIPAKLLFPRPPGPDADPTKQHLAMLGLGDVVLPGMMIGFALRLDLYLHYLKQQKSVPIVKTDGESGLNAAEEMVPSDDASKSDLTSQKSRSQAPTQAEISASPSTYAPDPSTSTKIIIKPPYLPATGHWGDSFWLSSFSSASRNDRSIAGRNFPKPYFHAALQGYVLGMFLTLGAMQVTGVAQPALLYLVPCVLVCFWGKAVLRGEARQVWRFDESEGNEKKEEEEEEEAAKLKKGRKDEQEGEGSDVTEVIESKNGDAKGRKSGKSKPSRSGRNGATTIDFLSLDLKIGVTPSRSTKRCLREEELKKVQGSGKEMVRNQASDTTL
ncbi:MAG: hypothetical protein LQ346_007832 [Caloplaca aetnensis]|nr:MAG: hypothetical protein LQ346_007832 [Caloplaca aetnensis]